uniref:YIPF5-like protein n=1 Tax=Phaseolus vulgaris TaxID=3885 RepID=T2DPU0_PHAVU|nr:YIPF5-like protein [Phaseolus vulgaris]
MANKEFKVPPVAFPSAGNPGGAAPNIQQRRMPTPPFQPNSGIPFMSFDIGSATKSTSSGPIYTGPSMGGGGSANFDDEEPLLDELGIHPDQIWSKIRSVLNPFRVNHTVHKDSDLSGPILLYMAFCLFQLLARKIQFGVILGWIVVSSIFLYFVFKMLSGRTGNFDLHTCTSVVGYWLLPVVYFSALSRFFLPIERVNCLSIASIFVLGAMKGSAGLVVSLADGGDEHRGLIAYASFLIYTLFSLLVIF